MDKTEDILKVAHAIRKTCIAPDNNSKPAELEDTDAVASFCAKKFGDKIKQIHGNWGE